MKLPLNEEFVRAAIASGLEERLVQAISQEIERRQVGFVDREAFFATLSAIEGSAKGYWSRGIKKDRINDPKALVKFLRLMRPAIEIDTRMEPWNSWQPGSRVIALVGEREVSMPNVSQKVRQRVVGARDSQAFAELAKIMYRNIGLDCEVVLEHAPSLPKDGYTDYLRQRLHEPGVGMICVLGSPVVNPLANPAAREIFRDTTEDFLPRFRWAYNTSPDNFLADRDLPAKKDRWAEDEEGVSLPHHRNLPTPYPRIGDDLVLAQMEEGKTDFPDAGIFMLDCTHPAILVLCAGHGGCGTLGCVSQLSDTQLIDEALELSRNRKMAPTDTKPGRIVGVVVANRRRKSVRANDSSRAAKPQAAAADNATGVDDLQVVSARMVWASVPCRNWA
jgi:hypothetical protein